MFSDELSEIQASSIREPRDLEAELFNKRTVKDLVTSFERELGLIPANKKGKNIKRHACTLSPSKDQDSDTLDMLLNDDAKYRVVMWKDTWTVHGEFRVFVIYEELLDDKKGQHDK